MLPAQEPAGPDHVNLLRLHALVPAAEELDLAEEADREREVAAFGSFAYEEGSIGEPADDEAAAEDAGSAEPVPQPAQEAGEEIGEEQLTEGQVRGLLEHRLGATPLPGDGDEGREDARATDLDAGLDRGA